MLVDTLAELKGLAAKCAGAVTWPLDDAVLVDCLSVSRDILQAVSALELHLIREIDGRDIPVTQHASGTAVWLREHLRISIQTAKRKVDLARALDQRPALDTALIGGAVNVEQASVVAAAVQELPADLGAELVDKAEAVPAPCSS